MIQKPTVIAAEGEVQEEDAEAVEQLGVPVIQVHPQLIVVRVVQLRPDEHL
ncbi:MAG: hypothetical protein SFH39_05555 [Candidatus Magnetobacterium sp. LHC-1]